MYGWTNRILHVNLTNSEIEAISTEPYAERFLGGRGIASRIYWERVTPQTKAFDPENHLIFMTGPLVAVGAQAATRLSVVGKSPMTFPEGFCYGNIGGFVGAEMKKAGFDGIVIEGCAPKPVYLWVHDGEAELRDASLLSGQGAYRTGEILREFHGEKVRFITTGVAGERRVRTAVVFASHHSTSSGGFGAVMGAKNFKALAIRGNGRPSVYNPDRLKELNRYTIRIGRRLSSAVSPFIRLTHHEHLLKRIGKGGCYQCGMDCLRGTYRCGNRLEGHRKCQSMEYYMPWRYSQEDEPLETFFNAPALANDYSIDTWELVSIIDWLYACFQSGNLTEKETGMPLSRVGTSEFLEKLLHSIAYREGFGDVLAEGLWRAGQKVSKEARALFDYRIAPVGRNDAFPPRAFVVNALLYPMEPRIDHNILHELSYVMGQWAENQVQPGTTPVTGKLIHDIARVFWGSYEAGDVSSYEGKALAAKKIQNRTYIKESLGLCDFAYPITYSENTPDHLGDPDIEAKTFTAVTGLSGEDIDKYGERICNLQRAILMREGREAPKADFPQDFNFTEPLKTTMIGRKLIVPGPGEQAIDPTGRSLDRDQFIVMLKEYYRLRGWDEETGIPRAKTLQALGLSDLTTTFSNGRRKPPPKADIN